MHRSTCPCTGCQAAKAAHLILYSRASRRVLRTAGLIQVINVSLVRFFKEAPAGPVDHIERRQKHGQLEGNMTAAVPARSIKYVGSTCFS